MKKHPRGITPIATFGLILAVFIIAGGIYYAVSSGSDTSTNTNEGAMEDTNEAMMEDKNINTNEAAEDNTMMEDTDDTMMEDTNTEAKAPGEYTEYSSTAFADASSKQRVLFFYAAWCPTCRPADANISANEDKIPEDVIVFRTNYDTESELKSKYGITYQHTFVLVDENGNALKKWNGGQIDEIIENVT